MSCVAYRRHLHQIPELDNRLPETVEYVKSILEPLGGGGHQTMAATQLKNTTKELAYQQLLSEIDNTLDDEENS